jgi:hypothetical protein
VRPADLGLGEPPPVVIGLGQHRRRSRRPTVGIHDHDVHGGSRHPLGARHLVPRLAQHTDADIERGPAGPVDPAVRVDEVANRTALRKAIASIDALPAPATRMTLGHGTATSSTSFMITPPCTVPRRWVSSVVMIRDRLVSTAEVGLPGA